LALCVFEKGQARRAGFSTKRVDDDSRGPENKKASTKAGNLKRESSNAALMVEGMFR